MACAIYVHKLYVLSILISYNMSTFSIKMLISKRLGFLKGMSHVYKKNLVLTRFSWFLLYCFNKKIGCLADLPSCLF